MFYIINGSAIFASYNSSRKDVLQFPVLTTCGPSLLYIKPADLAFIQTEDSQSYTLV